MKVIGIILLVLAVLLVGLWFLRVSQRVVYQEDGLLIQLRVGLLCWTIYPEKEREEKAEADAKTKKKKKKPSDGTQKTKRPKKRGLKARLSRAKKFLESEVGGSLKILMDWLPEIFDLLGEAVDQLRVDELYLSYTIAGRNDPAEAAMLYGGVCATGGAVAGFLRERLNIRRERIQASVDFSAVESKVYARVTLSYRVGQLVILGIHFMKQLAAIRDAGTTQEK